MKIILGEDCKCGDTLVKRPNGFYYKYVANKCDHYIARLDGDDQLMTIDKLKEYILEQGRIYDDIEEDDFVVLETCPKCDNFIDQLKITEEIVGIFNQRRHAS